MEIRLEREVWEKREKDLHPCARPARERSIRDRDGIERRI